MFNLLPALLLFLLQGSLASDASGKSFERSLRSGFAREIAIACNVWHEQEVAATASTSGPDRVISTPVRTTTSEPVVLHFKRSRHDRAGP